MTYSNFTNADDLRAALGIEMILAPRRFAATAPLEPSDWLRETLARGRLRASRSNTEKARSEWLIAPILTELEDRVPTVAVYSGRLLRAANLTGTPDFIIATNTGGIAISHPIFAVIEAKRDDFEYGAAQCVAALVAARAVNGTDALISGAVTNGTTWQFLDLRDQQALLDDQGYTLEQLPTILGVLRSFCLRDTLQASSAQAA